MPRDQAADAQHLYDSRGPVYDDSHHPRFARHMVELAKPKEGEHVLDLACGTGLVSFVASKAVGPSGSVVGVDISNGMLKEAIRKQETHEPRNITFLRHSITELDKLSALDGREFDLIICCSALVLLEHPGNALREWAMRLKTGGRLIVDVPHIQNLTPGAIFEKVGLIMDRPIPCHRLNFRRPEDLVSKMEAALLRSIEINCVSQQQIEGTEKLEDYITDMKSPKLFREYEVDEADQIFEAQVDHPFTEILSGPPDVREKAKNVFREEWKKNVNERGKVQEVDACYVAMGWATHIFFAAREVYW